MDKTLAPQGFLQIEWSSNHMPVLNQIKIRFKKEEPLKGLTLGACLHVTKETAVLIETLIAGGAEVAICGSNPHSTQDDVAAALAEKGVKEAAADDPHECTGCGVNCEKEVGGKCYLKGEFCLYCGEEAPTFWYKLHDATGFAEINLEPGPPVCVYPCTRWLGEVEVSCGESYDWVVVCGNDPEEDIQCDGIVGCSE